MINDPDGSPDDQRSVFSTADDNGVRHEVILRGEPIADDPVLGLRPF